MIPWAFLFSVTFGFKHDTEVARQPILVGVIKTEMASQEFGVRVELIETHEVSERYPHIRSNTSKSTKENDEPKGGKGGRDMQDGKGKDHQTFPAFPSDYLATFFLSGCCMAQRKVVVRAVALLSAKTKWRVANSLEMVFPKKQQTWNE